MRIFGKVVIRQPDLDTLVTAFILGVNEAVPVEHTVGEAAPEDLSNPRVLCLECGGSGEIHLGNFDHHQVAQELPPACVQALAAGGREDAWSRDLVAYAAAVDTATDTPRAVAYPNLSNLISGVRLLHGNPSEAFKAGLQILRKARKIGADIYGPLPLLPEWVTCLQAKDEQIQKLRREAEQSRFFRSPGGLRWAYLESTVPGVHGYLREAGCSISVAASAPAEGGRRKYSIAAAARRLDDLLRIISKHEEGWGGPAHGSIIGSPFAGSTLPPDKIINLVSGFVLSIDWDAKKQE